MDANNRHQPLTPGDLRADGELAVGVSYAGSLHREVTVGPLTVDAEMAAEGAMPDWIDPNLIYRFELSRLTEAELKKNGLSRLPISDAEKRRAARMVETRYLLQARFRVLRLGAVPEDQLPQAVGRLLESDMYVVRDLALEVDAKVARFLAENRTADQAGPDSVDGGGPDSAGPVAGI
ncbi:hypothetical protein [Zavarzinia sp.]|uniref:hypothetical protein n=1 Tax=Zavarzinia sp. TaxID=2027920 RepID=UPI003569EFD2